MRTIMYAAVTTAGLFGAALAEAANFDPRVITFGEARQEIQSTPVLQRPNRPLHIYGNAARRRHQRGASAGPSVGASAGYNHATRRVPTAKRPEPTSVHHWVFFFC